ncbi:MAG: arsenosugar biosynthesis radical SAM protein ArsS [Nitrospirota bacterium]|nr:arsenosugar biosynthesis radical SAM protein ArsS [Nitrospirota bacterium]
MIIEFKNKVSEVLKAHLVSAGLQSLQVNIGYRCNMACKHCHVNAGPNRPEMMERDTIDQVLAVLKKHDIQTLDITGGAPELNPHFTYLVTEAKNTGCHVIVRSNLTIFFEEGFERLPEFYCEHDVEVTASLPYYLDSSVDRVRGEGTFQKSIKAIRRLNSLGYGDGTSMRQLNFVYNPSGTFLAPEQKSLEDEYRRQLGAHYNILFDHLYVFSNMPIGRFRSHLEKTGSLEKYLKTLEDAFNPSTLDNLMCKHLISVGWDGALYDCDFNQVLGLHMHDSCPRHIRDFDHERLARREIHVGDHCYGCTAGQGST